MRLRRWRALAKLDGYPSPVPECTLTTTQNTRSPACSNAPDRQVRKHRPTAQGTVGAGPKQRRIRHPCLALHPRFRLSSGLLTLSPGLFITCV
jgi:hypothetical protein